MNQLNQHQKRASGNQHSLRATFLLIPLVLLFALFSLFSPPASAQTTPTPAPTPVTDPRFGIVEAFWTPEQAAEIPLGWERIIFYWREIQPNGPDDWNTLHVDERWLAEAQTQGRKVMGLLKNTPAWATDGNSEAGLPRGLYLPIDDPNNLWANYLRQVSTYYAPFGVHDWVIWNEPEIKKGVYGFEFDGNIQDYVQLLKVSYLVLKESDPEARVHLAGLTWWHDTKYLNNLLNAITQEPEAKANNYYFDAFTLHIYFRSETVRGIVEEVEGLQAKYGLDKEVWINETNAAPTEDPDWPVNRPQFPINLDQQAAFIVQAFALGFASGADSIGIYKMWDFLLPAGGESFGLLNPETKAPRPAFYALKTSIERLQFFTTAEITQDKRSYYVVQFTRPGGVTHVMWAKTAASVTITVTAQENQALLINATGNTVQELQPTNGVYTITLNGATCLPTECLVGGEPLFLVEEPPQPTPTPTTTPTVTPSVTPTPTFTPLPPTATATSTATSTAVPSATPTTIPTATPTPPPAGLTSGSWQQTAGAGFLGIGALLVILLAVVGWRKA